MVIETEVFRVDEESRESAGESMNHLFVLCETFGSRRETLQVVGPEIQS